MIVTTLMLKTTERTTYDKNKWVTVILQLIYLLYSDHRPVYKGVPKAFVTSCNTVHGLQFIFIELFWGPIHKRRQWLMI